MCLAIPGEVLEIDRTEPLLPRGTVRFGGITREVILAYVPEVAVGDHVLVHVGFAISVIDEDEAARMLTDLDSLEEPVRSS